MAQDVPGISREKNMLQDRGTLLREEGDVMRVHKAMHQ